MKKPNGRPISEDTLYAREVGVSRHFIKRLGGAAKLRSMSPEARALMLKAHRPATGQPQRSMRAHGMFRRIPGSVSDQARKDRHAA